MADDEQGTEKSEEGLNSESGTDENQTTQTTEVPEGQTTEEATPAQSNASDEDVSTALTSEEVKRLQEDRQHFQTESQKAKEQLSALRSSSSSVDDNIESTIGQEKTRGDEFEGMSRDDINDRLRDDPMLSLQLMSREVARTVQEQITKQGEQVAVAAEESQTKRVLTEFCAENKITAEEFTSAKERVESMGIKASPSATGEMLVDYMNLARMQANISEQTNVAVAKATRAVKQQSLTLQPEGSAPAGDAQQLTQEQIIQAKFTRSSGSKALDGFFSK